MSAVKKVFFGSLYAFNPVGVDQFVDRVRSRYSGDPTAAPFLAYDYYNNVLSCSVDRQDTGTPRFLLGELKFFIDQERKNPQVIEPAIRPLDGALVRKGLDSSSTRLEAPGLLDLDVDDYASDEQDALEALQHVTTYWRPKDGEIRILTTAVAEKVASLTGCSIYPEHANGRVRLVGGDFNKALKKLENLEPRLALQYQHREFTTAKTNANVLLLTTDDSAPIMEFERINNPDHAAYRRVIVDQAHGSQVLHGKCLCETRIRIEGVRDIPPNLMLQGIVETSTMGRCGIWNDFAFKTLGDEANKYPRRSSAASNLGKTTTSPQSGLGTNEYIDSAGAARVAAWTDQVDETIAPNSVPPEAPEQAAGRRRRVAVDSDDSDADEEAVLAVAKPVAPVPVEELTYHPYHVSAGADVAVSDLLKQEDTDVAPSVVQANTHLVTAPQRVLDPEPELVTSSRRRYIKADSEVESSEATSDPPTTQPPASTKPLPTQYGSTSADMGSIPCSVDAGATIQGSEDAKPDEVMTKAVSLNTEAHTEQFSHSGAQLVERSSEVRSEALSDSANNSQEAKPDFLSSSGNSPDGLATTLSWPMRGFDPNAYGVATRGTRGSRTTGSGSKPSSYHTPSSSQPNSRSSVPAPSQANRGNGTKSPHKRGTRHCGRGASRRVNQSDNLIDITDEDCSTKDTSPPPGLDIRLPMSTVQKLPNVLDEPMEVYRPVSRVSNSDLISFSSGSRLPPRSDDSASYVNTVAYKGPNIHAIKNAQLSKLYAMKADQDERKRKAEAAKANAFASSNSHASSKARKAADSTQDLRFHSTMAQKAGNPGKKRHGKQETKAEKKKRIEKALREAHGDPPPAKSQKPAPQDLSDMSIKKRNMFDVNPKIGLCNTEALQATSREQTSEALASGLSPIFEASRSFSGEVRFEVQLGQLLISSDTAIRDKTVDPKKWNKSFGQAANAPPLTSFTPALTTNGADIDRALKSRAFRGGKLWLSTSPGPHSVSYEFQCQSKHGNEFLITLDQSGDYEMRNSDTATLGMVGIHCPAQVWDACAVIYGVEAWSPSAEVEAAVSDFIKTVHVLPSRREVALVFRQPDNNEIMIRNVRMRRVSRHQCLVMDFQEHQLQVTEMKTLYTKVHPEDKKLWQAYEKSHDEMVQEGFVHYELSIIDTGVNEILGRNKTLELGELASPSAGKKLLSGERIKQMVDLTAHMLSKMDWMGSRNNGTLARAAAARELQRVRQHQSLPPMARSKLNPVVSASRMDPSRLGGAISTTGGSELLVGRRPLPGTRFGMLAEIYEDEHGRFAKGYGGARVPLGDYSVLGAISEAPLEPDDSASQMGRVKRPSRVRVRGGEAPMHADKPPGFW